nr:PREDICTED: sugar transporter ERD6-like 7 [Bemisia tabaci]
MKFLSSYLSRNKGYIRQTVVCCSVSIMTFVYGQLLAWPSLAIERISLGQGGFNVTETEISIIVSMPTFGEFLMPIVFGFILLKIGRRSNMILNAVVYIVAWGFITFATSPLSLMIANFAAGLGSAIAMIIGPIFIAEIADKRIRGSLISVFITAIAIGEVFSTSVGIILTYFQLNLISLVLAVVTFFSIVLLATESPSWHIMCGKQEKAEKCFRYYWNSAFGVEEEKVASGLAELKEVVEEEMKSACSYLELFRTPSNVRASIIVIALSIFQASSGIIAMLTYASTTLPKYDGFWQPNPTMALVNLLDLIFNIISVGLIDRLGRKPLSIISNAGDAVGTGIIASYFFIDEYTNLDTSNIKWVPYIGILVFISSYGVAMATMPHILVGELFPANVRYHASVVSVVCIAGAFAFFNFIYLHVCRVAGVSVMFLIFTMSSVAATIFSYLYMFETKNLSLSEIQMKAMGKSQPKEVLSKA